jgi:nitrate/nitrite transporter NarK
MSSVGGLHGWQWLYLVEGLPSILAGITAMFFLQDCPRKASWLVDRKRSLLLQRLDEDQNLMSGTRTHHTLGGAMRSHKVWLLGLVFFGFVMGNYGISFWLLPQIVKDTLTKDPWQIGLLTTIPWGVGAMAMVLVGHHSDVTGERRWHIAVAAIVAAVAFAVSALPSISGTIGLAALTAATAGITSAFSTFWLLPTEFLSGTAASVGIAWINSVGNLAGYLSPYFVGKIRDTTHSMMPALLLFSLCCLGSAVITISFFKHAKVETSP